MSSLCLGTMTFGVETDEPGAHQQLDRFLEAGGTFVDTADVALTGTTDVLEVGHLGLDRFDEAGRSRLATDPIALPFPERITSS